MTETKLKGFKEFIEPKTNITHLLLETLTSTHSTFQNAGIIQKALRNPSTVLSTNELHSVAIRGLKRIVQSANEISRADTHSQAFLLGEQNALIAALILFNLTVIESQQKSIERLSSITKATALSYERNPHAN